MSRSKKIMALFLSIVMVLGLLPASAFAANDTSAFSDVTGITKMCSMSLRTDS